MKEAMFRFENIEYLYALAAIPVFIIFYWIFVRWRKKMLAGFGDLRLVNLLAPRQSVSKHTNKFILLLLSYSLIVLALAGPQIGTKLEEVKRKGVDVIIALDVSNSMKADDIKPSRLERAKQAIFRLTSKMRSDRIGIIVFAGKAYTQLPLTTDYAAAKLFLSSVNSDMIPTQGTAIGAAIDLALSSFEQSAAATEGKSAKNQALIIITDGENHEDDAVGSAKTAAEKGVVIHTLGMGLAAGAPIPSGTGNSPSGFKKDNEGNVVISKLDENLLRQIATNGNGIFVRASSTDDGLGAIFSEVEKMEKTEFESKIFTDYENRFQYFIGIALLFLIFELLLSFRKNLWWSRINIFNENREENQ